MISCLLCWLYWNPPREAFTVPYLNHPIAWYGICFVFGLMLGYWILAYLFERYFDSSKLYLRDIKDSRSLKEFLKQSKDPITISTISPLSPLQSQPDQKILNALNTHPLSFLKAFRTQAKDALSSTKELGLFLTDRLLWFIVLGIIVGARLGHVFFYEWPRYKDHLIDIFKVWEGGLASHGGAIGVIIALFLYVRLYHFYFPDVSFARLADLVAIPTALVAFFIRLGNFFNQEIVGYPSQVPWAVIFAHPAEGGGAVPRHPVQLYEALAYLLTFVLLWNLWKRKGRELKAGSVVGLFFVLIFGSRFFIEFWKVHQGMMIDESFLQTGQYLSIPFILTGLYLLFGKTGCLFAKKDFSSCQRDH